MPDPLEHQEGGNHYKDMAIQPVEFCHKNGLGYCESSVIKYVCRHKQKNGAEDLRKAIHFLELLIELEYGPKSDLPTLEEIQKIYREDREQLSLQNPRITHQPPVCHRHAAELPRREAFQPADRGCSSAKVSDRADIERGA